MAADILAMPSFSQV